jgi:hypothetical protein
LKKNWTRKKRSNVDDQLVKEKRNCIEKKVKIKKINRSLLAKLAGVLWGGRGSETADCGEGQHLAGRWEVKDSSLLS